MGKPNKRRDEPCPECGQVRDRSKPYRDWRRKGFSDTCKVQDIDQLEYRCIDGVRVPVKAIEITMAENGVTVTPAYLQSIVNRYRADGQGATTREAARLWGVNAVITLFREDMSEFWCYDLTNDNGEWAKMTPEQYRNWIEKMEYLHVNRV